MSEKNKQNTLPVPKKMSYKDIQILDNLFQRTENLPEILHLRAADFGYVLTDQDKALLLETYSKLDDILKEVAAFINIKFPGCERHVTAWNNIDFDTKIGGIKVMTNSREHIKREWKTGLFDLKSLIKILKNETVLLIDEDKPVTSNLQDISSVHPLEHYTDEKVIPNQNLVKDTISFFESGQGKGSFSPIEFLNLLDKQYQFVKLNYKSDELAANQLKQLPLNDRQKHTLYGFILKWFGGYPVNNLDEDFNKTLKAIEREFLAYSGDTPEKHYCKADQAMRNRFEKYGIAFTTAINHGIDGNEILAAMGTDELEEKSFQNFGDLFSDSVNKGFLGPFNSSKAFLIAKSTYNYEYNVWLQTYKNWEYRNEVQYIGLLTKEVFSDFLTYKNNTLVTKGIAIPNSVPEIELEKTSNSPTIKQVALICHYTDRAVTRENAKVIVMEYQHTSGDALFNQYSRYRSKANRTGAENTIKKNQNKIQLFESLLVFLDDNDNAKARVETDLENLKKAVAQANLIL